ncbi:MAG: hypothetical protein UY84_C0001G0162 [Candidatus Adlerbacteria bacterium GW2011_GWA2_54_12]|nr:MAG: hypothetical protein UY83_C0008G0026 [Candidatus Adlerbacteria bacterium GW2011_GWA1_54_10]KKW36274.1 MAG: hypothetical protein UY84_C0001G0162 [Candidatus Adlerbacteria bacterium GW2011_GWA2_54_12]KKW37804.1 MAG: hypothetical protein UY86_C0003G0026 [Candidatus Adlerbacteria bacterium GW2011_GWB1_54_7]
MLRLAVGLLSFYVAYATWKNSGAETKLYIGWANIAANAILGGMFLIGYYTQWAALFALVFWIASFFVPTKYRALVTLSTGTRLLAIAILFSLLLSGAGALAYDLHL